MNTTDKIMALADDVIDRAWNDGMRRKDKFMGERTLAARQALRAEIEALVRDADLYRKLKTLDWYVGPASFYCDEAGGMIDYEDHNGDGLDSAINSAMQEKQS